MPPLLWRNSFQLFLVLVHHWKSVEKSETDPQFILGMEVLSHGPRMCHARHNGGYSSQHACSHVLQKS